MQGRHVDTPDHSTSSDQASNILLCRDAEERTLVLCLSCRLRYRRVYRLLGHVQIGFAAPIPAGIMILTVFFHSAYIVMKMNCSGDYRRECSDYGSACICVSL